MSDQTDDAIAAREHTRQRMEGDRPAPPAPPPSSPAHTELQSRAELWRELTKLVRVGTAALEQIVREAEEEREEAAARRRRMEEARRRGQV